MKKMLSGVIKVAAAIAFCAACMAVLVPAAYSAGPTEQQVLVDQAQLTFREFTSSPEMTWFHKVLKKSHGVLIVPTMYKAGFLIGGSGGKGVLLVRDEKTGAWRGPAFYNMGAATVGLQIGAEESEVIILAMTPDAVKVLMRPSAKLGVDASVAAGPVGAGASGEAAQIPTAAFVSFARSKGAFLGLTFDGSVVTIDDDYNNAYYRRQVKPEDIFMAGSVRAHKGSGLRDSVSKEAEK